MSETSELIAKQIMNGNINKRTWGDILFNVRTYGAKGDGSTNDTTWIQKTIDAAAVGGGIVSFAPGTYVTESFAVPSNVTLFFANGARLSITTGNIVTINGPLDAGLHQIFTGAGTVTGSIKVERVYPQWWGAKGDGVTNDTSAIQSACNHLMSQSGGEMHFPDGTYNVSFDVTDTMYYALFKFGGNTGFTMAKDAKIKVVGSKPKLYSAVFGVNESLLPIENIQFSNVTIEGIGLLPVGLPGNDQNPIGISFAIDYANPARSIQNVIIENCKLKNLDYGVYIVHRATVGSATRQTQNVKIKGCTAVGCVGSFVTADGEDIIIEENTADGVDTSLAYDAVSIHAGVNVQIRGNEFWNFGQGQVINLRNSPENLCGSKNISITNNTIRDCPAIGVQISAQPGESVYGVDNVMLSNNKIANVTTGIIITPGAATAGTPFRYMKVESNQINATTTGLQVNGNAGIPIEQIDISNNRITSSATTTGYCMFLNWVLYSKIAGNDLQSTANDAGHKTFSGSNLSYDQIVNNKIWPALDSVEVMTITALVECNFSSNYVRGVYSFTGVSASLIKANLFQSLGTNEGRTFGEGWEQNDFNNVTIYMGAAPISSAWLNGDKVINNNPAAGGYAGFICTTAGTPGTWKGYGAIQA